MNDPYISNLWPRPLAIQVWEFLLSPSAIAACAHFGIVISITDFFEPRWLCKKRGMTVGSDLQGGML